MELAIISMVLFTALLLTFNFNIKFKARFVLQNCGEGINDKILIMANPCFKTQKNMLTCVLVWEIPFA